MHTMIEYAQEYQRLFPEKPFSAVDSVVLSELTYLRYERCGIDSPEKAMALADLRRQEENHLLLENVPNQAKHRALIRAVAENPRLNGIRLTAYETHFDQREEKQFAAMTYLLEDGTAYVAFRGTDSTLVGWKEDFNMSVQSTVPSQRLGMEYLEAAARRHSGPLLVGGHSKGGNIAVYAAACCDPAVQRRIQAVYSHDGPGFQKEFIEQEGYVRIRDRIHRIVPESSVIGMLLHQQDAYTIVESNQIGIYQHSALSWIIRDGEFSVLDSVNRSARIAAAALNNWSEAMDAEQKQACIDAFFKVVRASEATTLHGLAVAVATNMPAVMRAISELPPETKSLFWPVLKTLVSAIGLQVRDTMSRDGKP